MIHVTRLCGFLITAPTWAHHIGLRWEWLTDDVLRLDVAEHCPGFSRDPKFPEISMSTWGSDFGSEGDLEFLHFWGQFGAT